MCLRARKVKMNEQQSFLDPKTLLAILLLGTVWIGWQYRLKEKYPDAYKVEETQKTDVSAAKQERTQKPSGVESRVETPIVVPKNEPAVVVAEELPESLLEFADANWSFQISSKGMGLKNIVLKNYFGRDNQPKKLGSDDGDYSFSTRLLGRRSPINFQMERVGERQFVGRAQIGGLNIVKKVMVNSETYTLDTKVHVVGADDTFSGLETKLVDSVRDFSSGMSFMPSFERQELFVDHAGETERVYVSSSEEIQESFSKVGVLGISTQYFALAFLDKSDIVPEIKAYSNKSKKITALLTHGVINPTDRYSISYVGFAGPKSLGLLSKIDDKMASLVDFGMFSFIGKLILKVMKGFHAMVGNWGVAIILLTILVRIILLPFNIMSYKSMKGLQKIQPQLKEIRKKFADDKMKLNQETMALMKEAKANPLGGCLPMLLQFPVFIALYQVIGHSIELYQAPFGLWILDLSSKDPYYVLPVIMSVTMFFQQKMTPTQMDPAQQKMMMFMPLMFMVFMISLPAGLTLYMSVSAFFAVAQQAYFMRDTAPATT